MLKNFLLKLEYQYAIFKQRKLANFEREKLNMILVRDALEYAVIMKTTAHFSE